MTLPALPSSRAPHPGVCVCARRTRRAPQRTGHGPLVAGRGAGQFRARAGLPDRAGRRGAVDQGSGGHRVRRTRPDLRRGESRLSGPARGGRRSRPRRASSPCWKTRNGDGRFDTRTDFAGNLTYPNGIMPWNGGVFVSSAPDLLYLQGYERATASRTRGESILTGFDATRTPQIRFSHPTLGIDNWVYLTERVERRQRDRPGAPRSRGRQILDERLTFQSLHACVRIDGRAGPVRPHLRRLRPPLHLLEPPSGHGTPSSSRDT